MLGVFGRNVWAATAATLLIAAACRDAQSPQPDASLLPGLPGLGAIVVSTVTTGVSIDPDGYTVTVDNGPSQHVDPTGVVTFTGLSIGTHTVTLSGVADNCSVNNTVSVTIPLVGSGSTTFDVSCATPPPPPPQTGDLTVSTSTTGSNLDSDGYSVTLDGNTTRAIGSNGSVSFTGLSSGEHTVVLSGVADNCTVSGGTSRTVNVPAGGTASTAFAVSCAAPPPPPPQTGDLTVTTSTGGSNLDPDGYTVTLDGTSNRAIGTTASVTFSGIAAGNHTVVLSGVADNCTVSGGTSRTVNVPVGGTASTSFAVSCAGSAPPPTGRVTGRGQVGTAPPQPGNDAVTFNFDVRADLTGRFTGTDYADLHPGGVPATLTTDPVSDPATSFTAYRSSSSACSDPSRGVEWDGVGREDTGGLVSYTIAVCDNGPANSGADFFSVFIPSEGFRRSGNVASGDIVKS